MTKFIETLNTGKISPFRTKSRAFCPTCQKPVDLMTVEQSAEFQKSSFKKIGQLTQNVVLHPIHNNRGNLMICANSLFALCNEGTTQILDQQIILSMNNQ